MKVAIVHPERRTLQSIALEGKQLPKRLPPTQRCELELGPGESLEFIASIGGNKKFGQVPLVIECSGDGADLRATLTASAPGAQGDAVETDLVMPPGPEGPVDAAWRRKFGFVLKPGAELGFLLVNPLPVAPAVEVAEHG